MREFSEALAEFLAGRRTLADLESSIGRTLARDPRNMRPLLDEIDRRYAAGGLPLQVHAALHASVRARAHSFPRDDDRTRAAAVPDPRSQSASSGWSRIETWSDGRAELGPGAILKGRFVLESVVGRGGMGVVYRARDLRKEEAQDRDPFVAIKVLNDEFRRHPDSLKALQREARRAQNLAHPNIATVFDFDRDGATVYIQMEFLDGEPLDKLTKRPGGLPYSDAYPLIAGMSHALSYAHGQGIVHADFKPGNCFLTKNNVVKVFDFGIARAAKRAGEQDVTRFDAGTLGALTPAYASCEMLENREPDPRDDVYALGCVAYELLAGKHPFGRQPATEARDEKRRPARIRGLTRRQFAALERALAFDRSARTPTASEFLAELAQTERANSRLGYVAAAGGILAVAGGVVFTGYWQDWQNGMLVTALGSGDSSRVAAAIEEYRTLSPERRAAVLAAARDPLLRHVDSLVAAAVAPAEGRYDYPRAESVIADAKSLIPDSALTDRAAALEREKAELLARLRTELAQHLAAGRLLPADGPGNDIGDVLAIAAQTDPNHSLLQDPELPRAYARHATAALDRQDFVAARGLIDDGLARLPGDAPLLTLRGRLTALADAAARERSSRQEAAAAAAPQPSPEAAERAALEARALAAERDAARVRAARRDDVVRVFESAAAGADYIAAHAAVSRLREVLPADDPYLVETAPAAMAAFLRREVRALLARAAPGDTTNLDAADALLTEGLRDYPGAQVQDVVAQVRAARDSLQAYRASPAVAPATSTSSGGPTCTIALVGTRRPYCSDALASGGQGPTLALVPAGAFAMGGGRKADALPAHPVSIPAPFAMSVYEISFRELARYCGSASARCPENPWGDDDQPAVLVSRIEAAAYADWLSAQTGQRYRLPTEAEWEYAARAGTTTPFPFGDFVTPVSAVSSANAARTSPLPNTDRSINRNDFRLFHMIGNVREWVADGWHANYAGAPSDGTAWSGDSASGVVRGGSYADTAEELQSAARLRLETATHDRFTGFRVVREL